MTDADAILDWLVREATTWWEQSGMNFVQAAVILLIGWYVSKLLVQLLGRQVARRFRRPSVTKTILRGIRAAVLLLAVALAANTLSFEAGDILLSVTVFSAVLGLVLAPIVGSVINGLFVLADQPYEIGDMIELVDREQRGYVEDITLRYTKVFTMNNMFLVIPNATMRERDIINYSAEDERSRLSIDVLVTYESDVDRARAIMEESARELPDVIESGPDIRIGSARYPAAPVALVHSFADNGILLRLRYWVKEPYRIPTIESKLRERIWAKLADADVEIAYPHSHLVWDETSGTARVSVEGDGTQVDGERDGARVDGENDAARRSDESDR